jgi:uncharacterized cysteine cluster protein YcgN (CxxCxxCC family)
MIDLPIGKALIAVEKIKVDQSKWENLCDGCCLAAIEGCLKAFVCNRGNRKDGKNVIYKLIDYKGAI